MEIFSHCVSKLVISESTNTASPLLRSKKITRGSNQALNLSSLLPIQASHKIQITVTTSQNAIYVAYDEAVIYLLSQSFASCGVRCMALHPTGNWVCVGAHAVTPRASPGLHATHPHVCSRLVWASHCCAGGGWRAAHTCGHVGRRPRLSACGGVRCVRCPRAWARWRGVNALIQLCGCRIYVYDSFICTAESGAT